MKSEIEKLYEFAGVEKEQHCTKTGNCYYAECKKCDYYNYTCYPPFTAEKQLKLIKWFMHSRHFSPIRFHVRFVVEDIESYIVFLWKQFTETEQEEIRKILKGE